MAKSGLDSLIDALRASGADVDGKFGNSASSSQSDSDTQNDSKNSGSSRSKIHETITDMKLVERLRNQTKRGRIITAIVVIAILAILYWWFHPPLNLQSETT